MLDPPWPHSVHVDRLKEMRKLFSHHFGRPHISLAVVPHKDVFELGVDARVFGKVLENSKKFPYTAEVSGRTRMCIGR